VKWALSLVSKVRDWENWYTLSRFVVLPHHYWIDSGNPSRFLQSTDETGWLKLTYVFFFTSTKRSWRNQRFENHARAHAISCLSVCRISLSRSRSKRYDG
jgi:hypothetical protein